LAKRSEFIRTLGTPVFLEDYGGPGFEIVLFFLDDGTEGELGLGRESEFKRLHVGPYRMLVDKKRLLEGVVFAPDETEQAAQVEKLRQLIVWFWHDLTHHFITPMARGQLWSSYGGLEDLRRTCVNLVRLETNLLGEIEGLEKIESAAPLAALEPLRKTFCPLEPHGMLRAGDLLVQFYRERALRLARLYSISYPERLEAIVLNRLERMRASLTEL
jgi:hypothetical protein